MRYRTNLAVSLIATGLLMNSSLTPPATARDGNPFSKLAGSWRGAGTARFDGGQRERLTCRGYYTIKNSGNEIAIALRCASAGAKIHLRSQLTFRNGRITGNWEERTFNAVGTASGRATGTSMHLAVNGGGLTGSMTVTFRGSSQSVVIDTSGAGFSGVSINLVRG